MEILTSGQSIEGKHLRLLKKVLTRLDNAYTVVRVVSWIAPCSTPQPASHECQAEIFKSRLFIYVERAVRESGRGDGVKSARLPPILSNE